MSGFGLIQYYPVIYMLPNFCIKKYFFNKLKINQGIQYKYQNYVIIAS